MNLDTLDTHELAEQFDAAAVSVEYVAEHVGSLDAEQVIRLRAAYLAALSRIRRIEAEFTKRFCDLGTEVEVDGKRYYPTTTRESERWDGPALISRVAAVAADWYVDRETGEVLPPAVFAEKVASATAKVLGGLAPSTKWRTSFLKEIGVNDYGKYRTFEQGAPKIGEVAG